MAATKIPTSEGDRLFRNEVLGVLNAARRHLIVISGELGSYDFPELREAAHSAVERGVRVDVYATEPRAEVVDRLRNAGVHVVVGAVRARDHFLAVDDGNVVVSLKHGRKGPSKVGSREGSSHALDAVRARGVSLYFRFLEDLAKGEPAPDVVKRTLEIFAADPAPFAHVPIGESLLGILGAPDTSISKLMADIVDKSHALGLSYREADPVDASLGIRNALAVLTLYIGTSAGMSLPSVPTFTGGEYDNADYERALSLVRTPVRVVASGIQNDT